MHDHAAARSRPALRRRDRATLACGAVVMVVLLAIFGRSIVNDDARAERLLDERFATRAELTAAFVGELLGPGTEIEVSDVESMVLEPYFDNVIPTRGTASLLDESGSTVVSGVSGAVAQTLPTEAELGALRASSGEIEIDGVRWSFVRRPVPGTSWAVVLTTPTASLHAPVDGRRSAWLLLVAFAAAGLGALEALRRVAVARSVAARVARVDLLSGLPNRLAAQEHLRRVAAASARSGRPYAVMLVDVDHFKSINDTFGHGQGDDVLAAVGRALAGAARRADFVARWGGEEFLVVVTDTTPDGVAAAAERFRTSVGAVRRHPTSGLVVTASIGAAISTDAEPSTILEHADAALYSAKAAGRNCVVVAAEPAPCRS